MTVPAPVRSSPNLRAEPAAAPKNFLEFLAPSPVSDWECLQQARRANRSLGCSGRAETGSTDGPSIAVWEQRGAQEQFQPVSYPERGTLCASTKNVDLLSKHRLLDDQVPSGAAHIDNDAHDLTAGGKWAQPMPDPLGGVSNPTCDLREEK